MGFKLHVPSYYIGTGLAAIALKFVLNCSNLAVLIGVTVSITFMYYFNNRKPKHKEDETQ